MSKSSVRDQNPQLLKFGGSVLTVADNNAAPAASGAWVKDVLQIPIKRFPPIPESYTWAIELLKIHYDLELDMPLKPTQIQFGFNLDIIDPDPNAAPGSAQVRALTIPSDPRVVCTRREYVAPGIFVTPAAINGQNQLWNVPATGTIDLTDGRGNGIIFVGSALYLETNLECQPYAATTAFQYSVSVGCALNIEYRLKHVGLDEIVQELTGLLSL